MKNNDIIFIECFPKENLLKFENETNQNILEINVPFRIHKEMHPFIYLLGSGDSVELLDHESLEKEENVD